MTTTTPTTLYLPVIFDTIAGGVTASLIGLPVSVTSKTRRQAEQQLAAALVAYLKEHPLTEEPSMQLRVARVVRPSLAVTLVAPSAFVARMTSPSRAAASRKNGRLGGRPRKV